MKNIVRRILQKTGYDLVRHRGWSDEFPPDFEELHRAIIRNVAPYTMTSAERLYALIEAVRHIVIGKIPGDIVECGVWKGGSMMAVALMLGALNHRDRKLYLFDTFEGMPKPRTVDTSFEGRHASDIFEALKTGEDSSDYCRAQFEQVQDALGKTGYPTDLVHLIKGKVEETIPEHAPRAIALLRLDTDWYESTKHELEYLFPRLVKGGILIVDDYGHWQGCKKAVDEYLIEKQNGLFLSRIDYTGRIGSKS